MEKRKFIFIREGHKGKGFIIFFSIILFIFFFQFYQSFIQIWRNANAESDIVRHSEMALYLAECIGQGYSGIRTFIQDAKYSWIISYPVWHVMLFTVYAILYRTLPQLEWETIMDISASAINAFCLVITWICVTAIVDKLNYNNGHKYSTVLNSMFGLMLMFVGPLDASGVLNYYYLGAYTGNIWHNPTYLIMRPCGVIVFFLYSRIIEKDDTPNSTYCIAAIFLALSAVLKPNFYQSFLPGLVFYCIVYFLKARRKQVFTHCIKIASTCVPVTIVALVQYMLAIDQDGGGIGFSFLYVWKAFTEEWELSLFVSIVFPLCTYIFSIIEKKWDKTMVLSMCMFISALIQYMCFYVKAGPLAGDFSWGFGLSIYIWFVIALTKLLSFKNNTRWKKCIRIVLWVIFFMHLFHGILYFEGLWLTGTMRESIG